MHVSLHYIWVSNSKFRSNGAWMTEIIKERIQKICLSLIIIQGKAKKYIYQPENVQSSKSRSIQL